MKRRIVEWRSYIWKKAKTWYDYTYERLNILKNWVSIYEKVIRPLYIFLCDCLKWAIPIIVLYGQKFSETVNDYLEATNFLM